MPKPIVAVVGRPNVGKSTLVNRLVGHREAIVHESRGVTRDRSYHDADWNGREFVLVDTGGIESARTKDVFAPRIRTQALAASEEADAIVFVVDGSVGVTDEDEEVARVVRKSGKPCFLVVNKLDDPSREQEQLWPFWSLGVGEPLPVSATHGHGTGDLLDAVVAALPAEDADDEPDDLAVAVIGRPNVGKSSLTNRLVGSERSIVSDVAGTTRDAIDTRIAWEGRVVRLVDTAGMRRRPQVTEDVEYYAQVRALAALERADVAVLVADASVGVTEQDQRLVGAATDRGCAVVLVLNKWDLLADDAARAEAAETVARRMAFAPWVPTLNVSALTGRGVDKVLPLAQRAAEARAIRIPTPQLNDLMAEIREGGHSVSDGRRRLKVRYATQTGSRPPVVTFFVNAPQLVDDNYERFLENRIRGRFDLEGTPLRLRFRQRTGD